MLTKYKIFFVIFFLLFFIFASNASAQVVINEFSSSTLNDWVEVYNPGESTIDLAEYRLRDSTASNKKDLSGSLNSGEVVSFNFSKYLNKDGDTVKLFLISGSEEMLKDSISYGDEGGICLPSESGSIGRSPDGSSTIIRLSVSTRDSLNGTENEDPCPTATSTSTPTSTPTPTSPSPSESPTSTPKPTVKAAATKKPTSKPKVIEEESDENGEDFILGLREELETDAPSSESEGKKKFPIFAGLFIVGGLGAIGFAGYSFIKNKRKKYNGVDDNNEQSNRPESL